MAEHGALAGMLRTLLATFLVNDIFLKEHKCISSSLRRWVSNIGSSYVVSSSLVALAVKLIQAAKCEAGDRVLGNFYALL